MPSQRVWLVLAIVAMLLGAYLNTTEDSSSPWSQPVLVAQRSVFRLRHAYRQYLDSRMGGVPCSSLWPFQYARQYSYSTPLPAYDDLRDMVYSRRVGAAVHARDICASGERWLQWAAGMFDHMLQPRVGVLAGIIENAQAAINQLRDEYGLQQWPPKSNPHGASRDPAVMKALQQHSDMFAVYFTYDSNRIEGSQLTLMETERVLSAVAAGLPYDHLVQPAHAQDALEAANHVTVWKWMEAHLLHKVPVWELTESHIRHIHAMLTARVLDDAGDYRRHAIAVTNAALIAPQPEEVPELMRRLVLWLHSLSGPLQLVADRYSRVVPVTEAAADPYHPVTVASLVHLYFVTIHPFSDGNGRTARLLFNYVLMALSFPPVNVKSNEVDTYYHVLNEWCTLQLPDDFLAFMLAVTRNDAHHLLDKLHMHAPLR